MVGLSQGPRNGRLNSLSQNYSPHKIKVSCHDRLSFLKGRVGFSNSSQMATLSNYFFNPSEEISEVDGDAVIESGPTVPPPLPRDDEAVDSPFNGEEFKIKLESALTQYDAQFTSAEIDDVVKYVQGADVSLSKPAMRDFAELERSEAGLGFTALPAIARAYLHLGIDAGNWVGEGISLSGEERNDYFQSMHGYTDRLEKVLVSRERELSAEKNLCRINSSNLQGLKSLVTEYKTKFVAACITIGAGAIVAASAVAINSYSGQSTEESADFPELVPVVNQIDRQCGELVTSDTWESFDEKLKQSHLGNQTVKVGYPVPENFANLLGCTKYSPQQVEQFGNLLRDALLQTLYFPKIDKDPLVKPAKASDLAYFEITLK